MKRPGFLSLGLLVSAALTLPSRSLSQASTQPVVARTGTNMMEESCPVGLAAQRDGMPTVVVTDGQPAETVQQLQLSWANRRQKDIVAAAVVIHGFDASPRIIPAGDSASPELRKTYAVRLNLAGGGHAMTSLTMRRFATISSIELKSIEYSDGARWSVSAGENCRILPNQLLLIDATTR